MAFVCARSFRSFTRRQTRRDGRARARARVCALVVRRRDIKRYLYTRVIIGRFHLSRGIFVETPFFFPSTVAPGRAARFSRVSHVCGGVRNQTAET